MKWLGTVLLALLTFVTPSLASTLKGISTYELIQEADLIIEATPVFAESQWQSGRIFTRYTMQVEEYFFGDGAATIEVELLGGEINGIAQSVSGVPRLALGTTRLLFLRKHPQGLRFTPIQLGLGVYDFDQTRKAWTPNTADLNVLGTTPQPISVSELRRQIEKRRGRK